MNSSLQEPWNPACSILLWSCSYGRKAAFPLTNDIEADESLRTAVFSQFRGNDEA